MLAADTDRPYVEMKNDINSEQASEILDALYTWALNAGKRLRVGDRPSTPAIQRLALAAALRSALRNKTTRHIELAPHLFSVLRRKTTAGTSLRLLRDAVWRGDDGAEAVNDNIALMGTLLAADASTLPTALRGVLAYDQTTGEFLVDGKRTPADEVTERLQSLPKGRILALQGFTPDALKTAAVASELEGGTIKELRNALEVLASSNSATPADLQTDDSGPRGQILYAKTIEDIVGPSVMTRVARAVRRALPHFNGVKRVAAQAVHRLRSLDHQLESVSESVAKITREMKNAYKGRRGHWHNALYKILDKHLGKDHFGVYTKAQSDKLAAALHGLQRGEVNGALAKDLQAFLDEFHDEIEKTANHGAVVFGLTRRFPIAADVAKIRENPRDFERWLMTLRHPTEGRSLHQVEARKLRQFIEHGATADARLGVKQAPIAALFSQLVDRGFYNALLDSPWVHTDPMTTLGFHIDSLLRQKMMYDYYGGWRPWGENIVSTDGLPVDPSNTVLLDGIAQSLGFDKWQSALDAGWVRTEPAGDDGKVIVETFDPLAVVHTEADAIEEMHGISAARRFRFLVAAANGNVYHDAPPGVRKANEWVATVEIWTLLLFSTVGSFSELGAVMGKESYSIREFISNVRTAFAGARDPQTRELAESLGVATRGVVSHLMMNDYNFSDASSLPQRLNAAFFRITGLEWWTNMVRSAAMAVGMRAIEKHLQNLSSGDSNLRAAAEVFFGVSQQAKPNLPLLDITLLRGFAAQLRAGVALETIIENDDTGKLRGFLLNFVDNTAVMPNELDVPAAAQDPYWRWVFLFKPFMYAFGRRVVLGLTKQARDVYRTGGRNAAAAFYAAMPVMLTLAALIPLAMLSEETRDYLRYGLWGRQRRGPSSSFDYAQRIISRTGILGPLDLTMSMMQAAEWNQSPIAAALGPAATHFDTLVSAVMSIGSADAPKKFKAALRRSTPVAGQFPVLWY